MANTTAHFTTAAAAATTTSSSSSSHPPHHPHRLFSHRKRSAFTAPFSSVVSHQQQQQQPAGSAVVVLDNAAFQKTVVDSEDLFIVEFFADWCGHCQQFAPEYEKAAQALKNIVPFVAVSDSETMKKFDVKGFPTIKAMIGQKGKTPKMIDFVANRTAQQLVHFTTTQIRELTRVRMGGKDGASSSGGSSSSSDVVELTHENFDKLVMNDQRNVWFIKFYATWCGHCKAMAPDWEKVARSLKGKVKIGKVDAATDRILAKRFDVKGFPTLKLFPMGKKTDAMAQSYEGPRKADDLERYAMTFFSVKAKAEQLINNGQVDECKTGVCVFAFLPHILDSKAAGRENYLKDLNEVVKASVTMPITFFWAQGGDHFDFEDKLQMAFGYPALVALNVEKGKYSIHRGNFEKESINSFLTGLMAGQVPLDPLPKELPKLSTIDKWDGKDGKAPEVEVEEDDDL